MRRRRKISLAIPASLVADIPHLREKTSRIGLIGRALAIFRVDEVITYQDETGKDQRKETQLIATLLSYMETPQYLRKYLFGIMPELKYAGTLPPLRTPHHPLQNRIRDLKKGEYREGVVASVNEQGTYVEIGVERLVLMSSLSLPLNTRVTIKITKVGKHPKVILADKNEIDNYWGYNVIVSKKPFGEMVEAQSSDLVIATSRWGRDFAEIASELKTRWEKSERILITFGAPTQGLYEIAKREGAELESLADYVINTIPDQGTETVRTEEAVYATLSILKTLPRIA